jgi:PAS domain S-box-containing protein
VEKKVALMRGPKQKSPMLPQSVKEASRRHITWLPWLVFLLTAGLSVVAWQVVAGEVRQSARLRFDRLAERMGDTLRQRFTTAAHLLHGAAALPAASEEVTAADWSVYLRRVTPQLDNGVVGLGYIERVARDRLDELEARLRAQGEAGFTAQREGTNPWPAIVVAIEPRARNTGVLGLDIGSGTTRRGAAEDAARRNELILSRRIRLDYDGKAVNVPGFLMLLPVFPRDQPVPPPDERLANVQGWVYAPIRIDHLMEGVADTTGGLLDYAVFEGDGRNTGTLLYDLDGHLTTGPAHEVGEQDFAGRTFQTIRSLDIYGRQWTLRISTKPEFDAATFRRLPLLVLAVGLVFSALGALLTWSLVHSRRRALQLAGSMTVDLRRAQEESHRLALVAGRTVNGVVLADRDWRVQWINDGFTRLFGYTLDEVKARQPGSFLAGPETDPKAMEAMAQASAAGRPYIGELLNYAKDGAKVWVELEIQTLTDARGERTGYIALQLDITERKRQAELLRAAKDAAERANAAKGQFLAMMSHEIRTPMNGVIGMASLLLDSPLTPEQRETAATIRQSGEQLLTIINDILDFSKIESGRLELDHTEFALRDCLEGALDLLAASAADKRIDLLHEIAEGTPDIVRGDATRLRQVLVNLVGNAVKFTAQGEVSVAVRALAWHPSGVDLHFAVRDTGIGILAEHMGRLFKPFSQVDASTTRRFGGTGLGLAICRRLVELMGGRISVESEAGHGSTFSFTIRLQEVPSGLPGTPPAARQSLHGRRVLIIEDNATSLRILSDMARNWGMETLPALTPELALTRLREAGTVDVVIIDQQLPGTTGPALAQQIRELPGHSSLPMVLLSGLGRRENTAGQFNAVVTKPVKPSQLFNALVEIFWRTGGGVAEPEPRRASAPPLDPPHPGRLLLAEDNSVNQKISLHQLASLGCRADVAANGAEVLAALERQAYDVVLLDVHMPVLGGLEAARQIRRKFPEEATRPWLIALTANTMPGDREACLAAGMDDYLGKPIKLPELTAALARARLRLHG